MAVEDEKTEENKRGRPPKLDLTQEICEKQELDTILGQLPSGYLILVHREEPQWCKGYLGKLYCDNENLDLDSIRDNFGGKVLSLRFVNAQGKMRGTKRVTFPDPPRRDGRVILEDEYSRRPEAADAKSNSPGSGGFIPPGMPPHLAAQLAAFYAGFPLPPPTPAAPPTNPLDVMQAQQIMNLMNSQMVAQQELARANMAHMKEMEQIRRDAEDERERRRRRQDTDKEPLGELDTAIKLIRELNGIKSELGSTDTTSAIIQNTAPIIQDAVTELIDLYKMKAQAEIAQHTRREAPPLPARSLPAVVSAPRSAPITTPKPGNGKTDPVELAKQLRQFYDGLSPNEQTEVMQAFLGQSEDPAEYDQPEQILDPVIPEIHNESGSQVLSDEDRALLNEDIDLADQDQEVQGGEYSGATEDHDTTDRPRD
jgi:hypothetical protein